MKKNILLTLIICTLILGVFQFSQKVTAFNLEGIRESIIINPFFGKYVHEPYYEDPRLGNYSVTEYKTPTGEIGYQILIYDDKKRVIRSEGHGVEWQSRTYQIEYDIASTTIKI